jgi:hypothetical protein
MTQAPPPEAPVPAARRPGLDPATFRQTLIVAAVLAAMFFGSSVLNEAIPAFATTIIPGEAIDVGDGVRIAPLEGWVVTAHENSGGIRLEKGVVVIDLYPETVGGSATALAQAYLDEILGPDTTQLTATDIESATGEEGTAARFAYQGLFEGVDVAIEGEVTAIFIGDQGVVVDAWSRQGELDGLLGEVHAMIATIEVAS